MKFVKTNLYLIICGVAVALAVGSVFWPLGSWQEDLRAQMTTRIGKVQEVRTIEQQKTEVIPGGKVIVGPIQQNVLDARKDAQDYMRSQAGNIADLASDQNKANRAVLKGNRVIPLLGGKEQPGYLPEVASGTDAHDYKDVYLKVTAGWPVLLAGTDKEVAAAPTATEVTAALDADAKARVAATPSRWGAQTPEFLAAANMDTAKKIEFTRNYISKRAASIRMYVTADNFDREAWAAGTGAPVDTQIFESLVKCWLQQDLVNAIDAVNRDSQGNPTRDVGQSGIKRLEWIKVGGGDSGGGGLFLTSGPAGPAMGVGPGPGAAAQASVAKTMTGRTSTDLYDVVILNVAMVVDPAKLNAFFDQLYRQNNAYTVLNVKQTTVDPFQAASEGYLYGQTQCIRVEVQIEALLFRKWTAPIMPASIRTQLGVPAVAAK
jgi:hypothetical protein